MKLTNSPRKRSKINPTHRCMVEGCGVKIFNKRRNAKYCKKCEEVMKWLYERVNNIRSSIKKYNGYKVKLKYRILK